MCLLDASKAFDCVHLAILFEKLCIRDIFVLVLLDLCVCIQITTTIDSLHEMIFFLVHFDVLT